MSDYKPKYKRISKTTILIAIIGLIGTVASYELEVHMDNHRGLFILIEHFSEALMVIGIIGTIILLSYEYMHRRTGI